MHYSTLPACLVLLTTVEAQWQPIVSGTTDSLTAIKHVDGRFLVAGGELTFLRSLDNGETFNATAGFALDPSGDPNPWVADMLAFHDSLVGYASAMFRGHQKTTDGGLTWSFSTEYPRTTRLPLNGSDQVIFRESFGTQIRQDGLLVNETLFPIYAPMDSICPIPRELNCPFNWVEGEDTIFSTGSYGWTLTSNDRGLSAQTGFFQQNSYLYSCHVVNGDTVAYEPQSWWGELFISHDKGVTWQQRTMFPRNYPRIRPAFRMFSAAKGLAWGSDGRMYMTTDSAMTWFPVSEPLPYKMNDLLFIDGAHVVVVGDEGTILSSFDGGFTWTEEESGTNERLHALAASDDVIIALGNNGVILKRSTSFSTGFPRNASSKYVMSIYPNPASNTLNVRLAEGTFGIPKFSATDALGRNHYLPAFTGGNGLWRIDISQLANGAHILDHGLQGVYSRSMFIVAQ